MDPSPRTSRASLPPESRLRLMVCRILLAASMALFGLFAIGWLTGRATWMSAGCGGGFLCLALATGGIPALRRWSFTAWILAAVAAGMCRPEWFLGYGDFRFASLFVPILQVIMFCMGTTLSIDDFARVARMPAGIGVGLVCQFTIMPLVGFGLASSFGLPPEIGAGIVLVGASPGGLASNVMAFVAKADVAMSVTMTAVATLMAPIMTPLLMKLLAGQLIAVDAWGMMWSMTKMVLLPVIGGVIFHHTVYHHFRRLERLMPLLSMVGIIIMTVLTVAKGRDNLFETGLLLMLACFLHTSCGLGLGYLICTLLRLDPNVRRTIALEVGMQNSGMAAAVAGTLNKVATLGLAPIVFGPIMNTTASALANYWRNHPIEESEAHEDISPPPVSLETGRK